MRLLHSTSLELCDFFEQDVPSYAIISHRWTKEEISYEDFIQAQRNALLGQWTRYGWTKISKAFEIARSEGIEWTWIDTICMAFLGIGGSLDLFSIALTSWAGKNLVACLQRNIDEFAKPNRYRSYCFSGHDETGQHDCITSCSLSLYILGIVILSRASSSRAQHQAS